MRNMNRTVFDMDKKSNKINNLIRLTKEYQLPST